MKSLLFLFLFLSLPILIFGQDVPQTMSFQGYLTDPAGEPVNEETGLTMKFSLYDSESAGALKWGEASYKVQVVDGYYTVVLGGTQNIEPPTDPVQPLNIEFDETYYLQITIGEETFTDRIPLTASPYSIGGTNANNIISGTLNVSRLADNSISSAKLQSDQTADANRAVTEDHIRDNAITSSKLLSNSSDDNLRAVSTNHIKNNAVTSGKIADGSITSAKLQNDASVDANRAVTTNSIRDQAVTSAKIGDDAVTADKLTSDATVDANRAVTTNHLQDNAITSAKIQNNAITSSKLQSDASVDGNRSVTTDHIRNAAVTTAKLATGSVSGGSAGVISDGTIVNADISGLRPLQDPK